MSQDIALLSLLYELSLTNLKHLKPEETAENFVKKMLSRRNLQYGAVWRIMGLNDDKFFLKSIYSMPEGPDSAEIKADQVSERFLGDSFVLSEESLIEGVDFKGRYAYFKLHDFGFLELYTSLEDREFSKDTFYPFLDVIAQFAVSLESGYSYQELQKEIRIRKKTEDYLKENEEKFRRIIDNIKLGLLHVDKHEIIQHANSSFLELVGYSLDEIIGKNASDLFFSDEDMEHRQRMAQHNEERIRRRSNSYEMVIRDKNNEKKYVIISGSPNYDRDGNLIGSIGIHLDITEEKKLKEENEFKDTQLKKIYEKSLDALVSVNEKGEIFEWSPQAEAIFGYKFSEIYQKTLTETIIPEEYREAHDRGMKNYFETGEGPVLNSRIEITGRRKSGEIFPIELTIFPLEHHNEHYFTAFIRDITEIKKSKEDMEKALARQKELNNLKSQFISMTSHELRTPLTTIRSNTELASYQLENMPEINREKLLKNISRIDGNVERLNQLINNILMIGQLDSKKVPFSPAELDLSKYIREHILPDYHTRKKEVSFKDAGEAYPVSVDKRLFSHIMNNLIENALKYSEGAKPPEVYLKYLGDHALIQVKDHGMGIPEEDQLKLFDTFFRASNVGNIQGTGLGLSIVKEFVKIHGGEISVDSTVGQGTTFHIHLPKN